MQRLVISQPATATLTRWLDQTMRGELPLHRLPAPVAAWYFAGWAERHQAALTEARLYEHRLDLAYLAAFSPKDRAEEYQRRLDRHFAEQDRLFFAEPTIELRQPQFERRAA